MSADPRPQRPDLSALRIERERRQILLAMVIESAFVAFLGGVAGIVLAPAGEFDFHRHSRVALMGLILAVLSGVIGGVIPAASAARMPITQALREF